jgi:hypothetical protein
MRLAVLTIIGLTASAQTPILDDQRVAQLARVLSGGELESMICAAPQVSFDLTPAYTTALLQAGVSQPAIKLMAARQHGSTCQPQVSVGAPIRYESPAPQPKGEPQIAPAPAQPIPSSQPTGLGSYHEPQPQWSAKSPTPIPAGTTLCLQPMIGGFDGFVIGEMQKQRVPVVIIAAAPSTVDANRPEACDPNGSFYTMTGTVVPEGKSFSARSIFGLRVHFRDEVQAAVKLVRNSDNAVVWAADSDRGEAKKVAEHIVNQMLKQRPVWIPSPINR